MSNEYSGCHDELCARCAKYKIVESRARETLKNNWLTPDSSIRLTGSDRLVRGVEGNPAWPVILEVPDLLSTAAEEAALEYAGCSLVLEKFDRIYSECLQAIEEYPERWLNCKASKGMWMQFHLLNQGRVVSPNCQLCPETTAALMQMSELMRGCVFGNAFFSCIYPDTEIEQHRGPTNARIRIHLGIDIPPSGASLMVNHESRQWAQGEILALNDFLPHSVSVSADAASPRTVLVWDAWHPYLTETERRVIQDVYAPSPVRTSE